MEILKEQYEKEVIPALMKKFNYKSIICLLYTSPSPRD